MEVCVEGAIYWKDYMLAFARMHIWAITRYTSNGPNKNTFLRLRKERALSTGKVERQLGCAPNC
ncbi:hypothetical protein AWK30_15080 [Listeria monocytogenes]|nr:hypothetical protein AWK30_15080 [Listeria monocytogenes]